MPPFYELQLILLTSFCVISLLLERYASKHQSPAPSGPAPGRLESGQARAPVAGSGVRSALTKKYLLVYAIVMGARDLCAVLTDAEPLNRRRRLAAGPIRVLAL